jgi:glutathione S-transferase
MLIFHIASVSDWAAAHLEGAYTTSTRGVSLAEEGFIHCSRYFQITTVLDSFYADHQGSLAVLTINPRRLSSPMRFDDAPGADLSYPHIYGPLNRDAVVSTSPIVRGEDGLLTFDWFLPGPLATTRLVLRAATDADWPAYRRTLVDDGLRKYLGGGIDPAEADARRAEVTSKGCVAVVREDEVVGFLLLGFYRTGDFELSYSFLPEHQGHGYAREAVSTLAEWVFAVFTHLRRLIAVTQLANTRSVALLDELNWSETDHFVEWGERQVMYALENPHPI